MMKNGDCGKVFGKGTEGLDEFRGVKKKTGGKGTRTNGADAAIARGKRRVTAKSTDDNEGKMKMEIGTSGEAY